MVEFPGGRVDGEGQGRILLGGVGASIQHERPSGGVDPDELRSWKGYLRFGAAFGIQPRDGEVACVWVLVPRHTEMVTTNEHGGITKFLGDAGLCPEDLAGAADAA